MGVEIEFLNNFQIGRGYRDCLRGRDLEQIPLRVRIFRVVDLGCAGLSLVVGRDDR